MTDDDLTPSVPRGRVKFRFDCSRGDPILNGIFFD
jgi:hypothetical protein